MKTKHYILYIILLVTCSLQAQVSNYSFSQKVIGGVLAYDYQIPYPEQTLASGNYNNARILYLNGKKDSAAIITGQGFPIDFDFRYDGQWMNRVGISGNWYIKLANSKDGNMTMLNDTIVGAVFDSANAELRANTICAFQGTASGYTNWPSFIKYDNTIDYPGYNTFRINVYYYKYGSIDMRVCISLREWKNQIDFYYSSLTGNPSTIAYTGVVGLRGKFPNNDSTNLNIRKITTGTNTWQSSVAGSSGSTCDYNSTTRTNILNGFASSGILYSFVPPAADSIRTPVAFFKCIELDSIPNYIARGWLTDGNGGGGGGFVYAKNATEIPVNMTLWWSPEFTSSTNYYKLYFGTDSLDMELLGDSLTTNSFTLPMLAGNIRYYYKIIAYNATNVAAPCSGSFVTKKELVYCSPSWEGNGFIKTITFNTQIYTHPGVDDYRRELPFEAPYTTTLQRDSSYLFNITALTGVPCFGTRCWIDFNQDGVFDASTEQFNNATYITVPHNAVLGTTKMRVGKILCTSPASSFIPCSYNVQYQDFTITIAQNDGCIGLSINPVSVNPSCFGDNNGSIDLNISGGLSPYTVSWQKNYKTITANTASLTTLSKGIYYAEVKDKNGCTVQTELLALIQPLPLTVDTLTVNDSLVITVTGGTKPYSYELRDTDGNIVSLDSIIPDSAGFYMLTVKDSNNCEANMDSIRIFKKEITGLKILKTTNGTGIYPNPASNFVSIMGITERTNVNVYNLIGAMLLQKQLNETDNTINISALPKGMYIVILTSSHGETQHKLIKE